jgi:hypothetical protein
LLVGVPVFDFLMDVLKPRCDRLIFVLDLLPLLIDFLLDGLQRMTLISN